MTILMTDQELIDLTSYQWPSKQLAALKKQGFFRARINERTGRVLLEREHYTAVCSGPLPTPAPKVRPPTLRRVA
ncbi:MAG: DUF4224 domain-containing protein [Comamonas sp.]|uniref:DUF4224 domain-containing protein n=1 Tax=Comamonas sp. TaxID=34028 RepID=UPI002FCA0416